MILEGRDVTRDLTEQVDVVVVGSGCGASVVGKELAAAGLSVLLLERGGYYQPSRGDFDQREDDMLARIDGGRGLHTTRSGQIALTYGNNVGGASVHYWADTWRTPHDRLELWEKTYKVRGHTAEELKPWFEKIEAELNVHAATDAMMNTMNQLFEKGAKTLGMNTERVQQARKGCIGSGYCMQGCSYGAKQSQLVTGIPAALARGARIFADCEVDHILMEKGRAVGVKAHFLNRATNQPSGPQLTVKSRMVIVAAGGFNSAAVLLRSRVPNPSGMLGQNLQLNPCPTSFGLFDQDVVMWRGIPAAAGVMEYRLARYDDRGRYQEGGYLLHPNQLPPAMLAYLLPGYGREHRRLMDRAHQIGSCIGWIDDVGTGNISLDRYGNPSWEWRLQGRDILQVRDLLTKQARVLLAAGASEVIIPDRYGTRIRGMDDLAKIAEVDIGPGSMLFAAPHPAGACRMGEDPHTSVVNFHHEVHTVKGLFVCDPSVFPTAVSVDPSETIMAFSYVAAGWIVNNWHRYENN